MRQCQKAGIRRLQSCVDSALEERYSMEACLAPNGPTDYVGQDPCTRLHVGTTDGVVTLAREAPGAAWRSAQQSLPGQHISSLMIEPRRGGLFAGVHNGGLYLSLDSGQTWERKMQGITQ